MAPPTRAHVPACDNQVDFQLWDNFSLMRLADSIYSRVIRSQKHWQPLEEVETTTP